MIMHQYRAYLAITYYDRVCDVCDIYLTQLSRTAVEQHIQITLVNYWIKLLEDIQTIMEHLDCIRDACVYLSNYVI